MYITVHTTIDTGCSPNNYLSTEYFNRNVEALSHFLVSSIPERVDLTTSGSTQPITAHVVLDIRHVDGRGRIRLMQLKFGILQGLRFDKVIGLYAISIHFMDVMQDLLALQLEFLQPGIQQYVSMLHGHCPQLLKISSSSTHDSDGDDVADMPRLFEEHRNNATSHQSYSILPVSNPNDSRMVGPLDPHALFDPEEAYE